MREKPLEIKKSVKVLKGWGYELHIHNDDGYCGKILHFKAKGEMSTHYHIDKSETWYILKGNFYVSGIHPDTAEEYYFNATEGDIIDIKRGTIHSLRCESESGDIMEVSTPDDSEDNYRVYKGDSQNKKNK